MLPILDKKCRSDDKSDQHKEIFSIDKTDDSDEQETDSKNFTGLKFLYPWHEKII